MLLTNTWWSVGAYNKTTSYFAYKQDNFFLRDGYQELQYTPDITTSQEIEQIIPDIV